MTRSRRANKDDRRRTYRTKIWDCSDATLFDGILLSIVKFVSFTGWTSYLQCPYMCATIDVKFLTLMLSLKMLN